MVYLISTISRPCDITGKAKKAVAVKVRYILQHSEGSVVAIPLVLEIQKI